MTSYTITKYEYYKYSIDDYYEIRNVFSEIFDDRDATQAAVLISSLGILKLLEDVFNYEEENFILIGEENHRYIICFFDREIKDLKNKIKNGFNPSWHEEFKDWIKTLSEIRQHLINKPPVINK